MALLDGEPRSAMATATESTVLGTVNDQTFQHILELAPSRLHMNFLRSVSERLRSVNSRFITEVMRTERLSLVGSMANSIIHDLKNPICIMRCCADLITQRKQRSAPARAHHHAEQSHRRHALDDAGIARLRPRLHFACHKERVSIWRLMDELNQQVLQLLPGQNVQFVRHLRYEGQIDVDLSRFTRVLCNLIKNAREAMKGGGILTLSTDLVQGQVVIRLSDTGCGIPAEILPKIFEPFVTHGKSHGTGLGMAIAKSVVEAHGGKISVTSVPGNGTTVDIRLPAPEPEPRRTPSSASRAVRLRACANC